MMDQPDGEKKSTICLPVLTECTNVTDRHTHTQTDGHRMTAKAAFDASIARKKVTDNNCINDLLIQYSCHYGQLLS